ncbi:MAG: thiopurine S-methyltransferase [Candidatus Hydrogenedentes bacterium]|nr:thiopurine S-methyltransferase [Candidatus Hydrogenedentota bacterium]
MDAQFWHQKWEINDIAFHQSQANPALVAHFDKLALPPESRVFVPLCGKTLDIHWLLANGYCVVGAELSRIAVDQLFADLKLDPIVSLSGDSQRYSAEGIDVFVSDVFHVTSEMLGSVDAVYDRAALVALPEKMRIRYAAHVIEITNCAPQLLISFVYDQRRMDGPPFSVNDEEIHRHFGDSYQLTCLSNEEVPGGLKGKCAAAEAVWLLRSRVPSA